MNRRAFHQAAIALALAPWLQVRAQAPVAAPRWERNPFALGVASGMPRSESVVLWTRLFAGPDAELAIGQRDSLVVSYEIYSDEGLRAPVQSGQVRTDAARAHSVHVHATGLLPGRDYWYRFHCGDATSTVGHTRTAPAEDALVARLRLALASCQHYEQGFFTVHREIARQPLDLVLFVGDYIYETTSSGARVRKHRGSTPRTLAQYRDRHAQYKQDPDLQAAHAAHPWLLMWDDHEVLNDYANDRDPFYTEPARFLQRRAAAYQAYFEHMPVLPPALAPAAAAGWAHAPLHAHYAWGRLADLWTLDCRQYRSPHACPDPQRDGGRNVFDCAELADPRRTMLGAQQEAWLAQGLAASRRRWRLLAQTTQIAPSGIGPPDGSPRITYTEAWDGYPLARQRLLQTVADARLANVVTLGGDVHHHLAANLRLHPNDSASPVLASEFVASAVTSRGLGAPALGVMRTSNPDIVHASGEGRGYALLSVTPQAVDCQLRATSYPVAAQATLHTQARFVVENDKAGIQPA